MSIIETGLKFALPIAIGFAGVRAGASYVRGELGLGEGSTANQTSGDVLKTEMLNDGQHVYVQVAGPFDPSAACRSIAASPSAVYLNEPGCLSSMSTLQGGTPELSRGFTSGVVEGMTSLPMGSDGLTHQARLEDLISALNAGVATQQETATAVDLDKFTQEERYMSVFLAAMLGLGGRAIRENRRRSKSLKSVEGGVVGGLEAGIEMGVASVFPLGGLVTIAAVEAFMTYKTLRKGGKYDGIEHPHSGLSRYSQRDFGQGENSYHSVEEANARSDEQAQMDARRGAVLRKLDEHEVFGRSPDRPPAFKVVLHKDDRAFVDGLANVAAEKGYDYLDRLLAFFKREQQKEYGEEYSRVWHHDRSVGADGPTTVDGRLEHRFFPSLGNLKKKMERFNQQQQELKDKKKK